MARRRLGLFAEGTTVSPEKSRMELEQILARYGAKDFGYMVREGRAASIAFKKGGRGVRFDVPLPAAGDPKFRGAAQVEAETRRRWRALVLVLKGKLEAVASGVQSFEREFLANLVVPGSDGQIVADVVLPALAERYANPGSTMALLGPGTPVGPDVVDAEPVR